MCSYYLVNRRAYHDLGVCLLILECFMEPLVLGSGPKPLS